MNAAELLKKVRKVEIKTKGLSTRIFSGDYHSAFKGRGMTFSEVRHYQFGDDVKNIDWNVTARYNEPFVKVFEEERELTVMLLIDLSASNDFGTNSMLKSEMVTEIAAVLSFSAAANNDKTGAIFFTDRIERFIPPRKGRSHVLFIIRELLNYKPVSSKTNSGVALDYLTRVIKKRTITFLLSDMIDSGYETPLQIASRKHDIIGIQIYDPFEEQLPDLGLIRVRDNETGESLWIDSADKVYKLALETNYKQHKAHTKSIYRRAGSDLITLKSGEPYIEKLHAFFKQRGSRI